MKGYTIVARRMVVVRTLTLVLALVLGTALAAVPAGAEEERPAGLTAEALIETARAALAEGKPDEAAFLLDGLRPGEGDVDDVDFLRGSIALQKGEWQTAIDRFRAMLTRNPELLRVRLDLGLAYFNAEEDSSAAYHFRQALGAEALPPEARARALAFLDLIRRRKTWSVTGSLALAPDTNINNATSARLVELFGLPAQLSEDARETSGIGLNANIGGGYEARISPDLRFRTSASLQTRTYEQSAFNDRTLSLRAGPRFLFERFDLRPELTARGRELGGDTYSRSAGLALSSDWLVAPAWRLSGSVAGERVFYEGFLGDGSLYAATLGLAHALNQATLLRADTSFRREQVERDAYSWREYVVGLSASRELPEGFVVTAGPSYRWRSYDGVLASLSRVPREDETFAGRITVSNRHISLFGFMPEVTVRYEERDSNVDLYDYDRVVADIGVVRTF